MNFHFPGRSLSQRAVIVPTVKFSGLLSVGKCERRFNLTTHCPLLNLK
jgi:hypothetical protein